MWQVGNQAFRFAILYCFECLYFQRNCETCKETRKYDPYRRKKKHSIESVSEEAKTLDLLDKDLKSALLNISKSQWKPSLKY